MYESSAGDAAAWAQSGAEKTARDLVAKLELRIYQLEARVVALENKYKYLRMGG